MHVKGLKDVIKCLIVRGCLMATLASHDAYLAIIGQFGYNLGHIYWCWLPGGVECTRATFFFLKRC